MSAPKTMCKAHGRQQQANKARRAKYRSEDRRNLNKGLDLLKHLSRRPNDHCAITAFNNIPILTRKKAEKLYSERGTV